jgi:anti-sigma28 factor (negative regulator of flagellin synthesis)
MRITDRYQSIEGTQRVAPAKAAASTSKAAPTTGTSDGASGVLDVHVSQQAQELSARAGGVEQLKKQIQNGTFKVDADAIASKLVGGDE